MAGTVHAGIRTEIHNLHAPPSKALDVLACEYPSTHLHRQHVVVAASILEANYTGFRVQPLTTTTQRILAYRLRHSFSQPTMVCAGLTAHTLPAGHAR